MCFATDCRRIDYHPDGSTSRLDNAQNHESRTCPLTNSNEYAIPSSLGAISIVVNLVRVSSPSLYDALGSSTRGPMLCGKQEARLA